MTDGLADMSRNDLFNLIAMEELPVKKVGKSEDLVVAIRNARAAKAEASVDPGTDIPTTAAPEPAAPPAE